MSCGVDCRHGSDPVLLWLWHRLAAVAAIRPRELPYATVGALKSEEKKKRKEKKIQTLLLGLYKVFHYLTFSELISR